MRHRTALFLLTSPAAFLAATAAAAAPTLDPLFGDNAVLQRERPIAVWGKADPGEAVTVTLGTASASATADASGAWRVELPAMKAGGPYRLTANGAGGAAATANDVLIGDVWLCSGQSNMEQTVSHSLGLDSATYAPPDGQLRLFTVPRNAAREPLDAHGGGPWQIAGPDTIPGFSAACYFMVRDLRQSEQVPIGAIAASWGGTQIRAWMSAEAVAAIGDEDARLFALYQADPETADGRLGAEWEGWWRNASGDAAGAEPWNASARLAWKPVPAIAPWESWGNELARFDGMVWFRKRFTLTRAQAARGATLELGAIDDQDQVWLNGRLLGGMGVWDALRDYQVPPGVLKAGENEIVVNVYDTGGGGGFAGPAERLRLTFDGREAKPLGDGWSYSVVEGNPGNPPRGVWDFPSGFTWIHNAMIAPLRDFGLRGVAWYQGEADVGMRGSYAGRLGGMMADWRRQFRSPELPFLIVSLANFGAPQTGPAENAWAALRNEQRIAAARDPNAALVVAMDLGEITDIHPANKLDLGHRLARAAQALAYGAKDPVGPEALRARRAGDGVTVEFGGVTGELHSWSGTRLLAFELCGEASGTCRYADAVADGTRVRIAGDGRPATRVRYGWANSPVTNLYDDAQLPAGPFELEIE